MGVTPNLATMTRLGNREVEAGSRAQSEDDSDNHTGARGVPKVKQSLKKRLIPKQGRKITPLTSLEIIPANSFSQD